jgi:hypothetical protein
VTPVAEEKGGEAALEMFGVVSISCGWKESILGAAEVKAAIGGIVGEGVVALGEYFNGLVDSWATPAPAPDPGICHSPLLWLLLSRQKERFVEPWFQPVQRSRGGGLTWSGPFLSSSAFALKESKDQ